MYIPWSVQEPELWIQISELVSSISPSWRKFFSLLIVRARCLILHHHNALVCPIPPFLFLSPFKNASLIFIKLRRRKHGLLRNTPVLQPISPLCLPSIVSTQGVSGDRAVEQSLPLGSGSCSQYISVGKIFFCCLSPSLALHLAILSFYWLTAAALQIMPPRLSAVLLLSCFFPSDRSHSKVLISIWKILSTVDHGNPELGWVLNG